MYHLQSQSSEDNESIRAVAQAGPLVCCRVYVSLPQQLAEFGGYSSLSAQAETNVDETMPDDFDCQFLLVGDDLSVLMAWLCSAT